MNNISVLELKARIAAGENIHLVDVREPHENADFNIGGTLLPLGKIQIMQVDEIDDWKEEEVVCYCRSGMRSGQACLMLETFGFKNVSNLTGGMLEWERTFGRTP
jgi:rhodanese-related sulfurtransferase